MIVGELACDRLVDAAARRSALIHAAVCEHCAARLAAQRALTAGLLEVAEATGNQHASPRVKRQLRAAVAERRLSRTSPVKPAPVMAIASVRRQSWPRWALAAAAAILALFTITAVLWQRSAKPAQEELVDARPAPAVTRSPQPPTIQRDQLKSLQATKVNAARRAPRRSRAIDNAADENEIASEFVPLTLAADEKALENGALVRLEVPRASLIALGLPLRVEGLRETVNAEVMMGDNGVAYAIRVVR